MQDWQIQGLINNALNKVLSIVSGKLPRSDVRKIEAIFKDLKETISRNAS